MLVPDSVYTPELLREKPLDKSEDFIQQCREEGFYIDPRTSSQFCRDSARSLVAAYNDGALPCDCDTSGSTGSVCDAVGGQCPCRPHVIGRQCTKCATGYFGFPYCRSCDCGRRLCDEVTGRCICPPQTVRPACDVCQNQTFSFHPLLGCENCECSPSGIAANAGAQCDRNTGQCSCKPRIGGRKCDRCAPGYYRFPDCVPCDCNQGGVTSNVCDPDTGRCLCKFVDMQGWRLESTDREEVTSVLNKASNTVVADIQELSPAVQTLHWVAPPSYLGNRVSSYGGSLTYQSKSFGIPSEGMTPIGKRPDVVLTGHNMTLIHTSPQAPLPDRLYQGRVQMLEGNWRHAFNNRPVSREELMMVLAGLVGLRIRALYFTQSQRLSLGEVGLEGATTSGTGGPSNLVEKCSCPSQYTGDSCEKCQPGYYRDGSSPFQGLCVPCECNGLSDECEDRTGRCLNCRYNTAGDRCERCKEGYYGDAALRTCRACPCPFTTSTTNFAVGCREVYGNIECICRTGYAGSRCERCAPGYYGDPLILRGSCRPCNCAGNGNSCDPRTGVCKNALEPGDTTTDEQCQECDNCAQTLLHDLEELDNDLVKIKAELGNATASASSQDRLKKLEKAMADTKVLVSKFHSDIKTEKLKVDQLENDMDTLEDDIRSLKDKADQRASEADNAVRDADKTHKRAEDLKSKIEQIKDLLKQLENQDQRGDVPAKNFQLYEKAKTMVKEMEDKNFTPELTAAKKESNEAKKLLDYIKNNVSKQCDENEAAADQIRGLLEGYEAKLKELDKALKDAADLVKNANAQNGLNANTLGDLQKRTEDLKNERKIVEDQMTLAKNELQKTEDLVKMLLDNKTEYEQLAAQLDGAKTDLTKKVNEISKAAAKKDIVEAAENHAKNLEKIAKDIEDAVKNASGRTEVRNAKDAIEAYKNIIDAINAAEAAAKEAKVAADSTLNNVTNQNLTEKAKKLKSHSKDLLTQAEQAEKVLNDTADNITDLNKRINDAKKKKKALEKDLLDAQGQLKDITRDDIAAKINEAKQKAASANQTASDTMDKLNKMRNELNKINVSPGGSNLNGILDDVSQTVNNLLNTIPSLTNKISTVENLTSQVSPINIISENIKMLKDLIEQARDAANKVTVPMNFKGKGHVELHPPKNLDDLKAYTAISLMLHRPSGRGDGKRRRRQATEDDMFVLYLGNRDSTKNYIGMFLRNNELYGVYKLNGDKYEIKTAAITRSEPESATFDRVDLRRIYQDAEMILTKDITSNTDSIPIKEANQGQNSKDLLDLSPDDIVFYVGGYPANFTPPDSLRYPNYKGCIEFFSLNDRAVSLYNFKRKDKINEDTPCQRYVKPVKSDYYEGTGFGRVLVDNIPNTFSITMSVNTRSQNGLLSYIGSEDQYLYVTMEEGVIFIHSSFFETPASNNQKVFLTEDWVDIQVYVTKKQLMVRVGGNEAAKAEADFDIQNIKDVYIGGAPQHLRERYKITMQPFRGCLKNLKLNKGIKPFKEKMGIIKGCPVESLSVRKAEFTLGSSLSDNLEGFTLDNNMTISLGFKSTENKGLILRNKQQANGIDLGMENGYVIVYFNDKMWKSTKQYNDGRWHYVTVMIRSGGIRMVIDDEDEGQEESSGRSIPDTSGSLVLGNENFKGCISNLYTRRKDSLYKAEDLSRFKPDGKVFVDVCSPLTPVQLMLDRNSKKDDVKPVSNESVSACALPAMDQHAYRLGGTVSRLSYSLPLQVLQPRPHFSLEVRTRSHEGMLFFAATRGGQSHLALYMSKGRIRLSVGKQKIFNREKYNDGKWHTVMFSLEKKKFRLVVDGIRAQDGQLTNAELSSMKQQFLSPVYLGSTPHSLHKELKSKGLPKHSVSGCVRNFKMNGAQMSNPTANHGSGPCFEGQTQRGAYFSGNGAHVVVNDSFVVGSSFELLFNIRPRSLTGLLLHVGVYSKTPNGLPMGHYLIIYMLGGEVVARVNNGNGEFMVSVKPKASLCDGVFHKISVIKRKNVVQLYVDTLDNYKIGPPFSNIPLTKDPLYVGGIPAILMQQRLPVTSSFVGCIQDMGINGELVSFERPSSVFGPVNLKECPG
ncbi:laminin subunit alpha-3-like isoform X2 [Neolamprologus brichardi]|uniref:laminin subunit alpha-3-like isoform X2 n=1 Tax=Neolamprologus brichardi TaxID=32507 RepID=UPI0003EC49EB|nr:laminin subunit alpha-3-like isoform X2 [Neolamprologus brichardi]